MISIKVNNDSLSFTIIIIKNILLDNIPLRLTMLHYRGIQTDGKLSNAAELGRSACMVR